MKKSLCVFGGVLVLCASAMLANWYGRAVGARADDDPEAAKAEAPPKIAASRITHVTVYPDSALVTREVEVPAGAGTVELVVSPLPERTINSSLYSEGSEGLRVMS